MVDPSLPPEDDPELDEHDPRVDDVDPLVAARATIVALEAIADLFASFALQANRLAGVLDASLGELGEDTLVGLVDLGPSTTWPNPDAARAARAEHEAAEIERRLADDDRTEVIRIPTTADLRFPRP